MTEVSKRDQVINAKAEYGVAVGRTEAARERLHRANAELKAATSAFHSAMEDTVKLGDKLIELKWWEHVDDITNISNGVKLTKKS